MKDQRSLEFHDGELHAPASDCRCGRRHDSLFDRVVVRPGALESVPAIVAGHDAGNRKVRCCLVADPETYEAAGRAVETLLLEAEVPLTVSLLGPSGHVSPDGHSAGTVLVDMPADTGLLIAVGSGTVTDVTRFVAARTGTPFVSIPTAPSVDAYCSNNSPMTHNGVKRTLPAVPAAAVIADSTVLASAPAQMISAGFGDTVGKLTSRLDWLLSELITGEYYCPVLETDVTVGVRRCAELASAVGRREASAVATLAESLMVSGAAMALVGNSRPASGSEHALSHYWEMKAAHNGEEDHLHGTKVGVGTIVIATFWERFAHHLARTDPGSLDSAGILSRRRKPDEIRTLLAPSLGPIGEMLVEEVTTKRLLSDAQAASRLEVIISSWDKMAALAEQLPPVAELVGYLRAAGGPAYPAEIGVDANGLREALYCSLEVRNRFTVMNAAEELGWLDQIIDEVVQTISDQSDMPI